MNISTPILILPSTREFDSRPESEDTGSWYRHIYPMGTLFRANIAIVVGPTHFCCIKNRWGTTCARDRIPNYMLKSYLLQYSKHLTKEALIDALCFQLNDVLF